MCTPWAHSKAVTAHHTAEERLVLGRQGRAVGRREPVWGGRKADVHPTIRPIASAPHFHPACPPLPLGCGVLPGLLDDCPPAKGVWRRGPGAPVPWVGSVSGGGSKYVVVVVVLCPVLVRLLEDAEPAASGLWHAG